MSVTQVLAVAGVAGSGVSPFFGQSAAQRSATTDLPPLATNRSDVVVEGRASTPVVQQDEVRVSKEAEALLLHSQGQSLGVIEATLGLPESTVANYLGITNGTETVAQAAAAAVQAAQLPGVQQVAGPAS